MSIRSYLAMMSSDNKIYDVLRQMAANFDFKPDERINEGTMASLVNASRTPVREAMNRLVAEGFLTFQPGRGFFCRSLSPDKILELYEARVAIECETVRLVCKKASDSEIADFSRYLDAIEPEYSTCVDVKKLLQLDEEFHLRIAMLAQSNELKNQLKNLNDRIRYIRQIDLKTMRSEVPIVKTMFGAMTAHRIIFDALEIRDAEAAVTAMRGHIERRQAEATQAVQIAYAQLYVPDGGQ